MLGVCRRPQGGHEELGLGYSDCEGLERYPIGGHGFPAGPDSFLSLCAEHIRGSQKILSEQTNEYYVEETHVQVLLMYYSI